MAAKQATLIARVEFLDSSEAGYRTKGRRGNPHLLCEKRSNSFPLG